MTLFSICLSPLFYLLFTMKIKSIQPLNEKTFLTLCTPKVMKN